MKVLYSSRFVKDLEGIRDRGLRASVEDAIVELKSATRLSDLPNVKKMKGHTSAFRVRVGNYRIGLFRNGEILTLHRFLDRKDIYKGFP